MTSGLNISAVIPSYNHSALLKEAIASVLAQTRPVQEVVVVDDGSTDETRQVVAGFSGKVRYVYQDNRGLSAARNTGIREARGDWLAFLDADDSWLPEKIRLQEEALRREPQVMLVYNSVWMAEPDGTRRLAQAAPPSSLWPTLRYRNCVCGSGSAVLVRKDVVQDAGGFDETLTGCEDWDLWFRLAMKHPFTYVPEPLAVLRSYPGSMSRDPERMVANTEKILERTLLQGLSGWSRYWWRRRIRCAALFSAGISARDFSRRRERSYLWRSLWQYPFPGFLGKRWASLVLNVLRSMR